MKGTFIQGLILAIAQILSRLLSLAFIFFLANKGKPLGLYLYTYSYIPFSLFLDISAFGIIPGISKSVSTLNSEYKNANTNYLLKSGTIFSIITGIIFYFIVNIFKNQILLVTLYEGYTKEEYDLILNNLSIASISILIYPLLSFYKGYMQGHMKMLPTALSIIFEGATRLILLFLIGNNVDFTFFTKVFMINFVSYLVGLFIILLFVFKCYLRKGRPFHSLIYVLRRIIPFGMATLFFTIYQLIDSITLSDIPAHTYTTYMFEAMRLLYIPIVACGAIASVLTPRINNLYTKNEIDLAIKISSSITNSSIIILVIIVYLFFHNSELIYTLFYGEGSFSILRNTAVLIIFIGLYKILIGLAQGMPKFEYIIIVAILSSIAKYTLNILLVPSYGYIGSIISTISALAICLFFSYYLLNKGGIKIFLENIKSLIIAFLSLIVSIFFAVIFNSLVINNSVLDSYNLLPSFFIILFYILIISFVNLLRVTKNKYLHINK